MMKPLYLIEGIQNQNFFIKKKTFYHEKAVGTLLRASRTELGMCIHIKNFFYEKKNISS